MNTKIDGLKITYNDVINGVDLIPPKWANECFQEGWEPVSALDFYDELFCDDLEPQRALEEYSHIENGKRVYETTNDYLGIAIERLDNKQEKENSRKVNKIMFTRGNQELYAAISKSNNTIFLAPASYCGKSRCSNNARYLYALCIEIDDLKPIKRNSGASGFDEMIYCWERDNHKMPKPTYIVCSGSGLHLYWFFTKPVPMFDNVKKQLGKMRKEFIRTFWSKAVTFSYKEIQYEHLLQGFRAVGSQTKKGSYAMAFRCGERISLEELNEYASVCNRVNVVYKAELPLARAKELYPDWYERRIINGEERGHYTRHRGIYDNWMDKMYASASVGHRYFCLLNLVALGTQCNIPYEEVEADCYKMRDYLDTLTIDAKENPFTDFDVECALELYGAWEAYNRNVDIIVEETAIPIQRNQRRRGKPQEKHIRRITEDRDDMYPNGEWREENGMKPKWSIVSEWRRKNPNGTKYACIKETGLSKPTVYKWWDVHENPDVKDEEAKKNITL